MAEKEQDKIIKEDKKEPTEDNKKDPNEKKAVDGEGEKPKKEKEVIGESIQNVRALRTFLDHR